MLAKPGLRIKTKLARSKKQALLLAFAWHAWLVDSEPFGPGSSQQTNMVVSDVASDHRLPLWPQFSPDCGVTRSSRITEPVLP